MPRLYPFVVPAKAGTHNHLRGDEMKAMAIENHDDGRGVWVPAFAGTTSILSS